MSSVSIRSSESHKMFREHSPLLITSGASKVATAPAKLAAKLRTEESFILIKGDTKESLQLNYSLLASSTLLAKTPPGLSER